MKNQESQDKSTIFVSGLPYTASEEQVKEFFQDCGEIVSVKLPTFQDSGRLLGYGHITFISNEAAENALKKNKTYMNNRYLDVQLSKGENAKVNISGPPPENCKSVFVKGFPYSMNEDQLGDVFRSCGEIANVRIVYNSTHEYSKGFGYIDFKHPESVKKAMELNNKIVEGRRIFVDYEVGKAKKGYKINMDDDGNKKYNQQKETVVKKKIKKEKKKEKTIVKIKDFNQSKKHTEKKLSLFD